MNREQLIEYAKEIGYLPSNSQELECDICGGLNIEKSDTIWYDDWAGVYLCGHCYDEVDRVMQEEGIGDYEDD